MLKRLAKSMPDLPRKLRAARMPDSPEFYLRKTMMTAAFMAAGAVLLVFAVTKSPYAIIAFGLFPFIFWYFLHYVDVRIIMQGRMVDQEIVYAGRFLIIELESGVPLYDTFQNLARTYPHVGAYFQEAVDRISMGTSTEDAMNQMIEYLPSDHLRKLFWQILNSLRTGGEVSESLAVAIDQVVREQRIQVVEYGRRLNPLAMFYMMMAVILPSLGMVMVIVMSTFIGFKLGLPILLIAAAGLAFIQFMFLAAIKSQRPAVAF